MRRGLTQSGQTFALERFRGTADEWVEELRKIWRGLAFPRSEERESSCVRGFSRRRAPRPRISCSALHERGEVGGRDRAVDVAERPLVLHLARGLDEVRHRVAV